jgi:hypothetical protein
MLHLNLISRLFHIERDNKPNRILCLLTLNDACFLVTYFMYYLNQGKLAIC